MPLCTAGGWDKFRKAWGRWVLSGASPSHETGWGHHGGGRGAWGAGGVLGGAGGELGVLGRSWEELGRRWEELVGSGGF